MDFSLFIKRIQQFISTFFDSSTESFQEIVRVFGNILLAAGIVLLGWIVGSWAHAFILKIGEKIKVSHFSEKIGLTHLLKKAKVKTSPAHLIGKLLKGYIITIFLIAASNILGFTQVAEFLDSVISYIPNVLIALVIILLGMRIADTSSAILEGTLKLTHSHAAKTLAVTAKYIIITFSILAALFELKIAEDLVRILFTGFIAMLALAGGLAFGLGGKKMVQELLEDLKQIPNKKKRTGSKSAPRNSQK